MSEDSNTKTVTVNWTKVAVAFITATVTLIGTLGTVYLKHYFKQKSKDPITQRLQSGQRLNGELRRVMDRTGASRITVAQFHNGSRFTSGSPYEKVSSTHQVVGRGVSRSVERVEDLPITLFENVLLEVEEKDYVRYDPASQIPNVGSIFRDEGVQSVYIFKLESVGGKYIGVMFIEYTKGSQKLSEATVTELRQESHAIGAYLSKDTN